MRIKSSFLSLFSRSLRFVGACSILLSSLALLLLLALPTPVAAGQPITADTIVSSRGARWNAPPTAERFFPSYVPSASPSPQLGRVNLDSDGHSLNLADPKSVIGPDGRNRIRNVQDFPYRAIVFLRIRFVAGSYVDCTGWVVAPRLVATAGHCVNDAGLGWAREASVIAAPHKRSSLGMAHAGEFFTVTGWVESHLPEFDYGAVQLDQPLGETTGWMGMAVFDDAILKKLTVRVTGFPADKPALTLWTMKGPVRELSPLRVFYDLDTFAGQSGAPLYNAESSRACMFCAIAIHGYGAGSSPHESLNSGVRVTQRVLENYLAWRSLP